MPRRKKTEPEVSGPLANSRRRIKPVKPDSAKRWVKWCPICLHTAPVYGVYPFRLEGRPGLRRWACLDCIQARGLSRVRCDDPPKE